MNIECFSKLKEIDSLTKTKMSYQKSIHNEKNRLHALDGKRQESRTLISELKNNYVHLHQKLSDTEKNLLSAEKQVSLLEERNSDINKINQYKLETKNLEDEGLLLLEEIESNTIKIEEAKTFLNGLEKTYIEIESEVKVEVTNFLHQISNIELRINLLQEELPSDFKQVLLKTLSKNLPLGPFTRIESGSCYFCRFKISKIEESEIDMHHKLKTCPQCDRIFIPYGA